MYYESVEGVNKAVQQNGNVTIRNATVNIEKRKNGPTKQQDNRYYKQQNYKQSTSWGANKPYKKYTKHYE